MQNQCYPPSHAYLANFDRDLIVRSLGTPAARGAAANRIRASFLVVSEMNMPAGWIDVRFALADGWPLIGGDRRREMPTAESNGRLGCPDWDQSWAKNGLYLEI